MTKTPKLIQHFPKDTANKKLDKLAYFKQSVVELCDDLLDDTTTPQDKKRSLVGIRSKIVIEL